MQPPSQLAIVWWYSEAFYWCLQVPERILDAPDIVNDYYLVSLS